MVRSVSEMGAGRTLSCTVGPRHTHMLPLLHRERSSPTSSSSSVAFFWLSSSSSHFITFLFIPRRQIHALFPLHAPASLNAHTSLLQTDQVALLPGSPRNLKKGFSCFPLLHAPVHVAPTKIQISSYSNSGNYCHVSNPLSNHLVLGLISFLVLLWVRPLLSPC